MSDESKRRSDKIVHGFVRNNVSDVSCQFPVDIINLVLLFYHIVFKDTFKNYDPAVYQVSNDDKTLTNTSHRLAVCYGAEIISSTAGGIYQWTFKIIEGRSAMAIGIDETSYIRKAADVGAFDCKAGKSKCYALWHDWDTTEWDHTGYIKAKDDSPRLKTNDIVVMKLDLESHTMSLTVNNDKQTIFKNITIGDDINYCIGVYMGGHSDSIELLDSTKL